MLLRRTYTKIDQPSLEYGHMGTTTILPPMNLSLRRHGYNVRHAHIYEKQSYMGPTQTLHPIGYTALGPNLINKFTIEDAVYISE